MDFANLTLPEVPSDIENMYNVWSEAAETQMLLTPLANNGMPVSNGNNGFDLSDLSPVNSKLSLSPEMRDLNLDPMAIMQSAAAAAAIAAASSMQTPQSQYQNHMPMTTHYSTPITPPSFHSAVIPHVPSPHMMQYNFMAQLTPEMNSMSPIPIPRIAIANKDTKPKRPQRVTADNIDGVFPCTYPGCGKVFTKQYNLRSHLRIHYVPKAHTCSQCPASFRRSHDLRRHERSHESTKAFSCFKCAKGFTRADALKRHHTRLSSPCFMGM